MGDRPKTYYRRLPGRGPRRRGIFTSLFSRCSLYLGDDHILAVDNHRFSEDYKRFYFSDIQAIIIQKTRRGATWNIVLAFVTAFFLAGAFAATLLPARTAVSLFFCVLSGAFMAFLLINIIRGPTSVCHIMTAVQEDDLPSLNRLRVARKVTGILRLAIERVQGTLIPEEVTLSIISPGGEDMPSTGPQAGTHGLEPELPAVSPPFMAGDQPGALTEPADISRQGTGAEKGVSASPGKPIAHPWPPPRYLRRVRGTMRKMRHYDGTLHRIAFTLMLADGILAGIDLLYHTAAMAVASSVLVAAYGICVISALAKQYDSDIPSGVRRVTWASLGFICVYFLLSYILMVTATMATMMGPNPPDPNELMRQWEMYRALINLSPKNSPFLMAIDLFSAVSLLTLGAVGLIRVKKHRDDSARV